MILKGQSVLGRGLIFSKGKELRFTNTISKYTSLNISGVQTSYSRVSDILFVLHSEGRGRLGKECFSS